MQLVEEWGNYLITYQSGVYRLYYQDDNNTILLDFHHICEITAKEWIENIRKEIHDEDISGR